MAAATMKPWVIDHPDKDMRGLGLTEVPLPQAGRNKVLVNFQAAALNYRDCAIAKGTFPFAHKYPIVPVSDGAGVVVEVGSQYGDIDPYAASTGVGGTVDGVFRQYGVYNESGLVKAGQYVLVQGTGGVSVFGLQVGYTLQLAKAAGAIVIATTSANEKAKKLKELGADHVINYRTTPDWGELARQLTPDQAGVDCIMDIGGTDTLEQSFKCIEMEGIINLIGFLGTSDRPQPGLLDALSHICTARGIYVGSRAMLKDMVQAFGANAIHPVLDPKVFNLEQGQEAFEYLAAQRHFGKVVVKIDQVALRNYGVEDYMTIKMVVTGGISTVYTHL